MVRIESIKGFNGSIINWIHDNECSFNNNIFIDFHNSPCDMGFDVAKILGC